MAAPFGCKKENANPTEGAKGKKEVAAKKAPPKPSERPKYKSFRPLLSESSRAELASDGLFIDLGTADVHKYNRGGWKTGWGKVKNEKGVTYAQVPVRDVDLEFEVYDKAAAEVVVRGRSALEGQILSVHVDGKWAGDVNIGQDWTVGRIPAKGLTPGKHKVELVFKQSGDVRAELDWIWFANEKDSKEPVLTTRNLPLKIGGRPKRALSALSSRSYNFYMQLPEKAVLVTDIGSCTGVKFSLRGRVGKEPGKEIWSSPGKPEWEEAVIDLSEFAGKALRLEMATEGPDCLAGWGEPEIMVDALPPPAQDQTRPKNAIVILIDTVRADVFGPQNPGNKIQTPHYDELAKKSTVFVKSYNNENWTKPSVATTLSGTYPSTHVTQKDSSKLPEEIGLISQHLKKNGFKTAGFVANGYVSGKFGFEKGWDVFKNYIRLSKPSGANHVYGDATKWLDENQEEPFLLYIQTIDPHVVYRQREETSMYFKGPYKGILGNSIDATEQIGIGKKKIKATKEDKDWLKAMYWGEVTYHDSEMGKFLAELETRGLFENTMLVVTNDHGEELGDHGKYGHGHQLYDDLLRSPLLFYFPKMFATTHRQEVVENVDVAPTVVDALGVEKMPKADGLSLLPLLKNEPVQRPYHALSFFQEHKRAARVGDYKLILAGEPEVFDVKNDPGEKNNIAKSNPIARRLVQVTMGEALAAPDKAQRMQAMATKRVVKAGDADIDPETRKQLEALGYFGE